MEAVNRPRTWARLSWVSAWLAATVTVAGCNYFRPADPEPPSGASIIPDYSSPDATLRTMALGIEDKGRTNGALVYAGALAESTVTTPGYRQIFWPPDSAKWRQTSGIPVPSPWTSALEQDFYSKFIALRGEAYQMLWGPGRLSDDVGSDQAVIYRQYLVTTESGDSIAIGLADLQFSRGGSGNWLITRWDDRPDPDHTNPTDPEQQTLGLRRLR
jgi:hypothetical protein